VNKNQRGAYAVGVLTILGGAIIGKYLLPEAGAALVAAGAFLIGKVQQQPASMRRPHPGAQPTDEI
jgi:hypothetical protein